VIGVVPTATPLLELGYAWDDVISLKGKGQSLDQCSAASEAIGL